MCPLPREARKLLGVALLATDYLSSLKLGRKTKKWRQIMVGGGGGEWNGTERISHLIELMVIVRFGLDIRSGLCDNWSVGL